MIFLIAKIISKKMCFNFCWKTSKLGNGSCFTVLEYEEDCLGS